MVINLCLKRISVDLLHTTISVIVVSYFGATSSDQR